MKELKSIGHFHIFGIHYVNSEGIQTRYMEARLGSKIVWYRYTKRFDGKLIDACQKTEDHAFVYHNVWSEIHIPLEP